MWWRLLRFLVLPPGISALHELIHGMIDDRVSLLLSQSRFRPADDLARSHKRERDGVFEHLPPNVTWCDKPIDRYAWEASQEFRSQVETHLH
jgi:hypothetical protein